MSRNCRWLVVVPTELERRHLSLEEQCGVRVEICGFGPVVAAARTANLIAACRPNRVLLCGIAGSCTADLPIGRSFQFSRVGCYGIGAGTGDSFLSAEQIGWSQWDDGANSIGDELDLIVSESAGDVVPTRLVSVCSASGDPADVARKRTRFPDIGAEDMEGFAVAAAARIADLSTCIVRGISNNAGNRDIDSWQVTQAMQSVDRLAVRVIQNLT